MSAMLLQSRMKKLFTEGFTAIDVAEPLLSFDIDQPATDVRKLMSDKDVGVAGIRDRGIVVGYVQMEDLIDGSCRDCLRHFDEGTVISQASSFRTVIECLAESQYCFVSMLGDADGVIARGDLEKPPFRMWLFGMISIVEMYLSRALKTLCQDASWRKELPPGRLAKAEALYEERKRRNRPVSLLDCLQLADKAHILMKDPEMRQEAGFASRQEARKMVGSFESLRNSLAHAQDIVLHDWDMIIELSRRLDKIVIRV